MRPSLVTILLLLIFQICHAQNYEVPNQEVFKLSDEAILKNAIKLAEKAKKSAEKENNVLQENYINSIYNLAVIYKKLNNYEKAEPLYLEVIPLSKKILNVPIYLNSVNDLANIYINLGEYIKAHPFIMQALTFIQKNKIQNQKAQYALTVTNLANLYFAMGNYAKAELFYIKAFEINSKELDYYHPDYARSINNLANLYFKIGNYVKAEPLYLQAFEIIKKISWENHPDLCSSLDNLADLYKQLGDYKKAEPFYFQAFEIRKKMFGDQNLEFATSLIKLGNMFMAKSDYATAKQLLLQALEINKKHLGDQHRYYSIPLENLASLYFNMGDYEKAKLLYLQVLEIKRKTFGKNHPEYSSSLCKLAHLYEKIGDNSKTDSLLKLSIDINERNWKSNFSFLSNSESEQFIFDNKSNIEYALSFLYKNKGGNLLTSVLNLNIFIKNVLLSNNNLLRQTTIDNNDPAISNNWDTYRALRFQISNQYLLASNQQTNLKELEKRADSLEKELIRNQPKFRQSIMNNFLVWNDIQNQLLPNEAAIDFVSFRYYDKRWTDTIVYGAFVIKSGREKPKFVTLCREDQLLKLLDKENNSGSINRLYNQHKPVVIDKTTDIRNLYGLIWKPIDSLLKGINTIYLSPSGIFHKMAFAAIQLPEGGQMIDRYKIVTLSNIRLIAEPHVYDTTIRSFALFGGIDYEKLPSIKVNSLQMDSSFTNPQSTFDALRNIRGGKWAYLPGSIIEIMGIEKIVKKLKVPISIYSLQAASEENFKQLKNGRYRAPSIMHIATHGFAFSKPIDKPKQDRLLLDDKRTIFQQAEDPLTRSGLVMAGGNEIWTKGKPFANREDGILTAREVSDLDLRGCVLATLSACETGLGDIKGSEGVFGLQRAFKMAGVQYLIVSLWKVPDNETAEFMETFYSNWLKEKMPIREAFRKTQLTMSKKYNPYQWAAFVLVE